MKHTLAETENTIVEIRTMGGAVTTLPPIPSGNLVHPFFADIIVQYDGANKTHSYQQSVVDKTSSLVNKAKQVNDFKCRFSAEHIHKLMIQMRVSSWLT